MPPKAAGTTGVQEDQRNRWIVPPTDIRPAPHCDASRLRPWRRGNFGV